MSNSSVLNTKNLGKYYIEMKNQIDRPKQPVHKLDKNGVLLYKIPYTDEYHYYPVSITLYALGNFEMYIDTQNTDYKDLFLKQSDWLVDNITIKQEENGVWEHNFELPYYKFKIPWIHGMAQGLAISVLLRAYQLTQNIKYKETADKAYKTFNLDIQNNGVKYVDNEGYTWLEEYAISPPPHILNGFIYATFGIYDFYRVTKNKQALNLFMGQIKTLENKLEKYDIGYWSLYNLVQDHPAAKSYHILHINQLKVLYQLTNKEIFKEYAEKWENYLNRAFNRIKVNYKRNILSIKQYGIKKSITKYLLMRRWKNG